MSSRLKNSIASLLLLILVASPPATAAPADWGESDWYKFIEATVSVILDKAYSGLGTLPSGAGGNFPLVDTYAALSGISASVKPGLLLYLQRRMRNAAESEDFARMDLYQAYYTALATGDNARLTAIQRRVQAALNQGPAKVELTLNQVFADSVGERAVRIGFQFFVGGNEEGQVQSLRFEGTLRSNGYSHPISGTVAVKGSGYQAAYAHLDLPRGAPRGSYQVRVWLKSLDNASTEIKRAQFTYAPKDPANSSHLGDLGSPPAVEVADDVQAHIEGPKNLAQYREALFRANARGGEGRLRLAWQTESGWLEGDVFRFEPKQRGPQEVVLRVWDEGRPEAKPRTFRKQVEVHERLYARLEAPAQVSVGESFPVRVITEGGYGRQNRRWKAEASEHMQNGVSAGEETTISAQFNRPGEYLVTVHVWDEVTPESEAAGQIHRVEVLPGAAPTSSGQVAAAGSRGSSVAEQELIGNYLVRTQLPSADFFQVVLEPGGRARKVSLGIWSNDSWSYRGGVFSFQGKQGRLRRSTRGFIFEGVVSSGSGRQVPFFQTWEKRGGVTDYSDVQR